MDPKFCWTVLQTSCHLGEDPGLLGICQNCWSKHWWTSALTNMAANGGSEIMYFGRFWTCASNSSSTFRFDSQHFVTQPATLTHSLVRIQKESHEHEGLSESGVDLDQKLSFSSNPYDDPWWNMQFRFSNFWDNPKLPPIAVALRPGPNHHEAGQERSKHLAECAR